MKQQDVQTSYFGPFITMVFLFFIVGFLTTANTQFQVPLKATFLSEVGSLKNTFATLITFSWFLAYPLCGGVGAKWIDRHGYKGTLIRGLWVMAAGLALFFFSSYFTVHYPAANLAIGADLIPGGFLIFLLGSFVTGASVTILQVVINPYLVACHVKGTQSIQRLAIGGSANSIGTTLAPYFVTGVVFGGLSMEEIKISQLMVPFIVLIVLILAVAMTLQKFSLPDIQGTKAEADEKLERSVWSFRHLTLGVVAIFFYVGVEVCIGGNINLYAIEMGYASPALLATLYWGGMLLGRLVGFHSIMWGAIFTLSVAGLGKYTSLASGVFMIGVVGGALLPLAQGLLADALAGWRYSWLIVLVGELFMLYYARSGSKIRPCDRAEAIGD